jgi:hypothetical protein
VKIAHYNKNIHIIIKMANDLLNDYLLNDPRNPLYEKKDRKQLSIKEMVQEGREESWCPLYEKEDVIDSVILEWFDGLIDIKEYLAQESKDENGDTVDFVSSSVPFVPYNQLSSKERLRLKLRSKKK